MPTPCRVLSIDESKAFEYAPIGMAVVTIDGTILKVNRAIGEMFGYTQAEMANLSVWRITHPDDMPATIAQLQRLLEGEIDTWFLEKRYFHRDGHLLWGRSTTWLVRDADGRAQYVVSQVQDITEWKRLQEQTRLQQAELAHVLRVATMGETVAQIAHEINQPLASIANFANGLVARFDRGRIDVAAMRAVADEIAGEALRASEVIRRLRDFLRKGDPQARALRRQRAGARRGASRRTRDPPARHPPRSPPRAAPAAGGRRPHPGGSRWCSTCCATPSTRWRIGARRARDLAVATELHGDGDVGGAGARQRHRAARARGDDDFRSVLHHQGQRPRPRALDQPLDRPGARRQLWALRNADRGATVGFTLPSAA